MKIKFISLASGSSGNCYYIGTEKYGILIDAGIAVRTIKKGAQGLTSLLGIVHPVLVLFSCLHWGGPTAGTQVL